MSKHDTMVHASALWELFFSRDPAQPHTIMAAARCLYDATGCWPSRSAEDIEIAMMRAAAAGDGRELGKDAQEWINMSANRDKEGRISPPAMRVCAVLETAGSLGVPSSFLPPDRVSYYSFFHPIISPDLQHFFQAIALGEIKSATTLPFYLPAAGVEAAEDATRRGTQEIQQMCLVGKECDAGVSHEKHGAEVSQYLCVQKIPAADSCCTPCLRTSR